MTKNIYFFSRTDVPKKIKPNVKVGLRGKEALEFASLNLPLQPGFIIDAEGTKLLKKEKNLPKILKPYIKKCEYLTSKQFGSTENPMILKIVISPSLAISNYPTLHCFGLTNQTLPGFNQFVGEDFGYHEVLFLLRGYFEIERRIAEMESNQKSVKAYKKALGELSKLLKEKPTAEESRKLIKECGGLIPEAFLEDAYTQVVMVLKRISHMLSSDELDDDDVAILMQPMVYGNYGIDSYSGRFYTRNIVTGEKKLQGEFQRNTFDSSQSSGKDINKMKKNLLKELEDCARLVEDHFKEIRSISFTIEKGKVWFIDQRPLMAKSTQSDIKTLLDLHNRKKIDDKFLINALKPNQLNEILHPVIDLPSTEKLEKIAGGIAGAPGACVGRIYFSTEALLDAYREAKQLDTDTRCILCLTASFAEDVKAIEVSTGVLSSEGGYSAHASVVSRQYGKVSLVKPELTISENKGNLNGKIIKEGDYITLSVPHHGEAQIYFGEAKLITPDLETSGLLDFIQIAKKYVTDFHVRVNADKARDAELALKFGAEGIGLCRTEHMFFEEKRINVFREMIVSDSTVQRKAALKKLKSMQKKDFYDLFKIMVGKSVTIRLLDAPFHEFLPHNDLELQAFLDYMVKERGVACTAKEIQIRCDTLKEFNPMLGHRGCRIAVSHPEIYEMQVQAIFEAIYDLQKEGIKVLPELMIPLIMNEDELKLIIHGKKIEGFVYKGIATIEKEVREAQKARPVNYKVGTMIELPASAISAGDIACYAEFFSFGTNDLTQTTLGLSRDDYNSFMPDYTLYDIIQGNPFSQLDRNVKELITTAVRRGVMTRPTLKKGLCGEHGANPDNIKFCMQQGLDYVSCSTYSVPIANLAVAQLALAKENHTE